MTFKEVEDKHNFVKMQFVFLILKEEKQLLVL